MKSNGIFIYEKSASYKELSGQFSGGYIKYSRSSFHDKVSNFQTFKWQISKRIMDIVLSLIFLLLTLPIFLICSLVIKLTSYGPIFFRQERLGINGKPYEIIKFRTMIVDAEKDLLAYYARSLEPLLRRCKTAPR